MRLIYGHDYYDNVLAYGRDDDVVFVRSKAEKRSNRDVPVYSGGILSRIAFKGKKGDYIRHAYYNHSLRYNGFQYYFKHMTVVFCGKEYRGIQISMHPESNDLSQTDLYFWNHDKFIEFVHEQSLTITAAYVRATQNALDKELLEYFDPHELGTKERNWLIENRITILVHDVTYIPPYAVQGTGMVWNVNPDTLKDIEFYRIVDPYTAFQEISMWVGGVLPRNPNPMVEITDDKVKISKHGFDKFSFRKAKEQK